MINACCPISKIQNLKCSGQKKTVSDMRVGESAFIPDSVSPIVDRYKTILRFPSKCPVEHKKPSPYIKIDFKRLGLLFKRVSFSFVT